MTIHPKRGGVWGVRWFAMCAIGQRMAQRVAIICVVLLPLVSFCYTVDQIRDRVRGVDIYSYDDNFAYRSTTFQGHIDDVIVAFKTMTIAVECTPYYLNYPDIDDVNYYTTNSYSFGNITHPVYDLSDKYYRVSTFSELPPIFKFCQALYSNGYRGAGFVSIQLSGSSSAKINFNYSLAVADIASSTNLVFQRLLLNHLSIINSSLSSIGSSVQNVSVDLGQFQRDYSFVNSSYFDISNVIDFAASDSVIPSRVATSLKSMARDPSNYDYIHSVLDMYRASQWLPLAFSDSDLASPLHNDARVKQGLKNFGDSFGSGAAFHYTTPLTNELHKLNTNWVSQAKAALSNNTFQITNQLSQMFDDIPNSLGRAIRDTANNTLSTANAAGSIDQRLANGLTVSVVNSGASSVLVSLDGPINIDQTQFNSLSVPLGSLQNTVSDWYSDWYSFFSVSSPVYKWENFYNMVSAFKDQNHIDLSAVTNSLSSISSLSNLLAQIDFHLTNSLPNLTNLALASSSFSALLLDHYEDYISNSVYASSISKLQSDYPSVYSNLVDFGLSPSGDGDFWSLFGSSLIQLDLLADNFISDMALVRKFADDNIQGGFSTGISSIIEVMPKKEDIVSSVSAASNIVSALDLSSTNLVSAFHSVTSRADSVFTPFRGTFETPPSDLVLFKTGNDKYITIPVHEHPEAFRLMRWGFSFALAAVNFIFFPKFVLMLVMLFSKLSQRFVKFYPSVKDE